jgi:glycosyltransferase involved in cell wall biosynthesis
MPPSQVHILSFEGPDPYSRAGGLATRVEGLSQTLAGRSIDTHLWFVGDPERPGHERQGCLSLHRWAQWVSRYHPGGVYDGEYGKCGEFSSSLPPYLFDEVLRPQLARGGRALVLAEEWQTVEALLQLHRLLEEAGLRERVALLWNANNTFGFDQIDWGRLTRAAVVTTVSRYMRHCLQSRGVEALVVPNGLSEDAFLAPDPEACSQLRRRLRDRTVVVKMARWDPDKRWLATIRTVAEMKRAGWNPLLVARGGNEPHGAEVLAAVDALGLRRVDRAAPEPGAPGLLAALGDVRGADVVNLRSHVDPDARRILFRASDAVLANSGHEPFGLVGLETMAVGGIACTGATGEDYAVPGQNALVLQTDTPEEFLAMLRRLKLRPDEARAIRREGRATARRFAWPEVVDRVLLPRVGLLNGAAVSTFPLAPRRVRALRVVA